MRQRWISRLFKGMTAVILSIALAGSGLPETGIADRDNTNAMAAEIMGIDGDEYNIDEIDEESEIRDNVSNDSVSDAEDAATGLIQEYSNGLTTNEAESSDSPEEAITDQEAGKGSCSPGRRRIGKRRGCQNQRMQRYTTMRRPLRFH